MALENAVDLLRGKIGTKVTVTLHRARPATQPTGTGEAPGLDWNTEPFDVPLIRDKIRVKSVRAELKRNGDVLYVRLNQFQARTGSDLRRVLAENNAQSRKGIVLDLRNNPGGLLDQAIEVADAFLKEGKIVYTDGRDSSMHKEWFAADDGTEPGRPLVVLLNGGTASASEIVAGALKDHGAATLVGTRSFGKGSVQTILRLRDGSGIRLTTALYYTPSGRSIQAEGIRPDIEVADVTDLEEIRTREEDLDRHLTVTPDGPGIGNGATNSTRMLTVPEKIEKLQKGRDERERLKDAGQDPVLERGIAILLGEAPGATTSPAGATDRQ
jgi:carboxyl-terminal processing protease